MYCTHVWCNVICSVAESIDQHSAATVCLSAACLRQQERQRERREKKFGDLLEDYFYRSDHVDIDWEQGRDKIGKHSVVKEMEEDDW